MRKAIISIQLRIDTHVEDMTLNANLESRNTGACRRR
jgi:hypothetical protein